MKIFIFVMFVQFCIRALSAIGYLGNNDYPRVRRRREPGEDVGTLIGGIGFALWAAYLLWVL